jgi:glycosyltransferase XagB
LKGAQSSCDLPGGGTRDAESIVAIGRLNGEDADLERARFGLVRAAPALSARRVVTPLQIVAFVLLAAAVWNGVRHAPDAISDAAHTVAFVLFASAISLRLFAAAASMAPAREDGPRWEGPLPVYTLLCPLYRESESVGALVSGLRRLAYPPELLDVKLIVEGDDGATLSALTALALPQGFEIIVVPTALPRTKPKALNYALAKARGAFVGVYDAEDAPHPAQLQAALDAFARGGDRLGAVQAPLLIDNAEASWLASQFAAEYAIQFRGVLPLLAHLGAPFPLGGASNHFRRAALDDVGGWDPFNVTEDADLAYRLARSGWRLGVISPPTWEEAPARLMPWLKQRTRWIKGHFQTWLVLMRNPVRTAREMGLAGFLWMQLVLGGGLVAACAHAPLLGLLLAAALLPDVVTVPPVDWALVIFGYATASLGAVFAAALEGNRRLALSALTMPFYWPLSSIAALWALVDLVARPHYWAKTDHGSGARHTPT